MTASILVTKLFIPPTRPKLVPRPRLVDRLDEGLHRKLTLISAPAGFGKTTLVTEWLDKLRENAQEENQTGYKIAWLSLDEGDNDPMRFLTYFIAALNQFEGVENAFGKEVMSMLQAPQPPSVESVLTPLINEIAAIPDKIIFVLDDYHLIDAQPLHDTLSFILDSLPLQMHLIIATREDPFLPLSRLRARSQLTELRAADLRFTPAEATEFLNQRMGLNLTTEEISALESHTEGWITGLQLAAISMQGKDDTTTFINSFTGSHRFVLDYLIEEVLTQQPQNILNFLLQTAILKRLTGPLCNALTGQEDGQPTLEYLDRANLFIIPLDNERCWYRYHHLFAELLQQRMNVTHPELINDLHSKAVTWYEANGHLPDAIHHAFAGHDTLTAIRLIEKGALDALERSDFRFIFNSVDQLPKTALKSSPWLFVYHTWALLLTGQIDAAAPRLENTDWLLESVADDENQKKRMQGYIAGLMVQLTAWQRDYPRMIEFNHQAREYLPKNHWILGYCAMMRGTGFWAKGNLTAAKAAFLEAASIGKASGNKRVAVTSGIYLGHTLELEGHLGQAAELFEESIQFTKQDGRESPLVGYFQVEISKVLYELNQLDLASQRCKEGIKRCKRLSDGRFEKLGHCLLTRVYMAKGDFANASNSIQNAEQAHPGTAATVDMRGVEYPQIRLWLAQKKLREVESWLNESDLNLQNISHFKTKLTYTMHARALIALGRKHPGGTYLKDALNLLEELYFLAEKNGWMSKEIEILVLQSLALQEQGDTNQAFIFLERALTLAEPEGFIRTFVDEGEPMAHLLYKALSRELSPDYVRQLLGAFPTGKSEPVAPTRTPAPESDWVEPLSEREIEVLQLIAEGLTNQAIAKRLYLTVNTVKAHTRNIYSKLGVNNRTQAVARGKTIGILSPV